MWFFIFIIVILFVIIVIFASPTLSPIPYFPSNAKDLPLILKALNMDHGETVIDMGAGDGTVIFAAAHEALKKEMDTEFIAVEINPVLAALLYLKWIFHPNRSNIKIVTGDMFKAKYKSLVAVDSKITVYIYVSPRFIPRIINHMSVLFPRFRVVSYYYPIESTAKPYASGEHDIFTAEIKDKMV